MSIVRQDLIGDLISYRSVGKLEGFFLDEDLRKTLLRDRKSCVLIKTYE